MSDEVRPDIVRALARVDTRLDPTKAEVAYHATQRELDAALRLSVESTLAVLRDAGVVIIPNALDLTLGDFEVVAACWGIVSRWDVARDRGRSMRDAVDALADAGVLDDAARVLVLLRMRGLLPSEEDGL